MLINNFDLQSSWYKNGNEKRPNICCASPHSITDEQECQKTQVLLSFVANQPTKSTSDLHKYCSVPSWSSHHTCCRALLRKEQTPKQRLHGSFIPGLEVIVAATTTQPRPAPLCQLLAVSVTEHLNPSTMRHLRTSPRTDFNPQQYALLKMKIRK